MQCNVENKTNKEIWKKLKFIWLHSHLWLQVQENIIDCVVWVHDDF